MTQTQLCAQIITERLPWRVIDSQGREVQKPAGRSELETLLLCHKSNIMVEATSDKGEPHPLQVELDAANTEIVRLRDDVARLEATYETS